MKAFEVNEETPLAHNQELYKYTIVMPKVNINGMRVVKVIAPEGRSKCTGCIGNKASSPWTTIKSSCGSLYCAGGISWRADTDQTRIALATERLKGNL